MENIQLERKNEVLEQALEGIMTAEQYASIEHGTPYIFELKVGDKELHYFGAPHRRDPKDPIFSEIEENFKRINPDIVFIEGVTSPSDMVKFNEMVKTATFEEAIDRMGESGFTLKLAVDTGVDWLSPEPTDQDMYQDLLDKGFSKEEIFSHEVLHVLPQYKLQVNQSGFKQYAQYFIDKFKNTTGWEGFDYSYEHAMRVGEQICGESLDVEGDRDTAIDRIDPIPREDKKDKQTVLNKISEVSSLFRDRNIVSSISKATETHQRIFVVYGASHAVMQEPALRKLFT